MKKILAVVLAAMMLLGCAAAIAEGDAQVGSYQVYNMTGEKVTALLIIDKTAGTATENYVPEGLADGESVAVEYSIPAGEEGGHRLILLFVTESGYAASFNTLSIEEAPIQLLSADASSSATNNNAVKFAAPEN